MPSLHKLWFCCIALLATYTNMTKRTVDHWSLHIIFNSPQCWHWTCKNRIPAAGFSEMLTNPQEKHQGTSTKLHPIKVLQAGVWMLADREQRPRKVWMNLGRKKQPLHKYVSKHFERKATEISYMTYWRAKHFNTCTFLNLGHEMSHEVLSGHCDAWDETWNLWLGNQRDDLQYLVTKCQLKGAMCNWYLIEVDCWGMLTECYNQLKWSHVLQCPNL